MNDVTACQCPRKQEQRKPRISEGKQTIKYAEETDKIEIKAQVKQYRK